MNNNTIFINRANDLAWRGMGQVSPNPLVGAVLVYNGRIIGEGWHKKYGEAHAEVNAFKNVKESDINKISKSTLYVSLEPCNFYGKTPACTELIISKSVNKVIINSIDSTNEVNGKGVQQLIDNGINVTFIQHFKNFDDPFHYRKTCLCKNRAYVICKYAESADGFIGNYEKQIKLTNALSNRFTHKLRTEVDAILIGTNTALTDNPQLTIRYHPSNKIPVRIIIDNDLKLPKTLKVFTDGSPTWIINTIKEETKGSIKWICFKKAYSMNELLTFLYQKGIGILLLEGGTQLIQSFHDEGLIDEYYRITTPVLLKNGIKSPVINGNFKEILKLRNDIIKQQYR